ncbi:MULTISPECIES: IS5 family transposase [Methylomicrobium]|uniref:Transposase, IS5 family n=1 Tax=Methylomicrobium album BG8 TaxID=686340 RepID=H8GQY6_METAL|nr:MULTISPECIES: IS5 family transposase [Methylomicrobium]EIC28645.1 transposase, IS5 family [Methylomicrobium album BG8]EIC29036.1 transposase, IS5 family [Methylomicrobium album BG8]EIC29101.1 transposase, IS5 family [Methylomicrobium album BG8]
MKQLGLSAPLFVKKPKQTRRQQFLQEMEQVVPWSLWASRIAPHYPTAGRGRRPFPLATMLRIHLMQQWFGYSDPAMEEVLHDMPLLREFAGLDAGEDALPDETTILKFRHLLERHQLAQTLFDETAALLAEKGLLLRQGTIVDATLIAAPPSTKNRARKRDAEMSSTKKGNNYHFGMKAHIGVDAESGLVHTVEMTTAKVADGVMTEALLHGEERVVLGDRAYTRKDRNLAADRLEGEPVWAFPFKRGKGEELPVEQALHNHMLAPLRAMVEHPFRIVKRQFGYTKVRYRGLFKNAQQLYLLFALGNLYHVRQALQPT